MGQEQLGDGAGAELRGHLERDGWDSEIDDLFMRAGQELEVARCAGVGARRCSAAALRTARARAGVTRTAQQRCGSGAQRGPWT